MQFSSLRGVIALLLVQLCAAQFSYNQIQSQVQVYEKHHGGSRFSGCSLAVRASPTPRRSLPPSLSSPHPLQAQAWHVMLIVSIVVFANVLYLGCLL